MFDNPGRFIFVLFCAVACFNLCRGVKVFDTSTTTASLFENVEAALAMKSTDRSIVYLFSLSNAKHIVSLVKESSLPISEKDMFCFNLSTPGDDILDELDSVAVARSASSSAFTFLLISGIESLQTEKEVGKLNFLHSVTDVR
jgi:hypothetical protein